MKKAYINPTTDIINIETAQMIAGSTEGFDSTFDTEGKDGDYSLSRGTSVWGDDDDED